MNMRIVIFGAIAATCFISSPALALQFPPTSGRGAPARTVGGGMRGTVCIENQTPLTALIPADGVNTLTGKKAVIFVYVPAVTTGAELFVRDDSNNAVYETKLSLTGKAGVMRVSLPDTVTLQPNKDYRWEFSVICDAQDRTRDQFIEGILRRVEVSPTLQAALQKASPIKQAELYAQNKIWQETLLIASDLRRKNSPAWEQLLNSVGLTAIAKAPFVEP